VQHLEMRAEPSFHPNGELAMAMVCPQCNEIYDQHLECPTCGVRMLYDANPRREDGPWQQTPWGRMLVGLLLAQGLAHGMRFVVRAGLQLTDEADEALFSTAGGILLLQGLQGFGLLVGGTLCGAGQLRGILYGSFVGLVNGLIFVFIQLGRGEELNEVAMYGQPVLHLAFGGAGGLLGTLIWKPLPRVRFQMLSDVESTVRVPPPSLGFWSGRISWLRVVAGVALVVGGVVWSKSMLVFLIEASEGWLAISTHLQGRLVTWEICAIAALVGAGLAGATTVNGIKQGLLTGLGAAIVIMGLYLGNPQTDLDITSYLLTTLLALTLVGGWFGSQLFPPIAVNSRRRRLGPV
jgi:hypothetical protein